MHDDDPALAAELAALRGAFDARLREDLAAFLEASDPGATPRDLALLAARAHRLAGAAGSFGEPALSEAARRFEERCGDPATTAALDALRDLLLALRRALGSV